MPSKTVKVVALSDLHGHVPPDVPECDILFLAGDICPHHGRRDPWPAISWLRGDFAAWLDRQPAKHVLATWGNHDWIGQNFPDSVPDLRWKLLIDKTVTVCGLKIFGAPWQPEFFSWAYNLTESELEKKWKPIPDDTDVLLLHGPPYGIGDLAPAYPAVRGEAEHVGSPSLTKRIEEVGPSLVLAGHIHCAYGVYRMPGDTVVANVSYVDESYAPCNDPFTCELEVPDAE